MFLKCSFFFFLLQAKHGNIYYRSVKQWYECDDDLE